MGIFKKAWERRRLKNELELEQARNRLAKIRTQTAALEVQHGTMEKFNNSGYSHGGASRRRSWAAHYHAESLSAKSDIEENRKLLRERSRDLSMNAPIAAAAVNSVRTNCIGPGLKPKPKIDHEFLGLEKEEADALQRKIKKEFALWAESTLCDVNDQNNFYELQQIVLMDWLRNGEEFVLIQYGEELPYMPYQLRLKTVEADRVCTKGNLDGEYDGFVSREKNGNVVMNGIELERSGKVAAYHICSVFPGEYNERLPEWTRVEKRGRRTGNLNVLHIYNAERAEQYRGVPFLAAVIESVKQLSRYTEAEIMAAVINAMLAVFVYTENGDDVSGFGGADEEDAGMDGGGEDDDIKLGCGTVNFLKTGEKIEIAESKHPSGSYDEFMQSMAVQIGAALEIAPEMLLKRFQNNFSASKGAANETWKALSMRRGWFVNDFCQEVYNLWFAEAVSKGRIHAPGFFTNPLVRKAYTNATWNGPAQGCLDPVKEVNAAVTRIKNGLSTHEDECAAVNGSDFEDNVRTLEYENERLAQANQYQAAAADAGWTDEGGIDEED